MLIRSATSTTTNLDEHQGRRVGITNFFGQRGQTAAGPQVFMVDYPGEPGVAVRPHFHSVNQFQVFFAGDHVGSHVIEPITVHYADAYTSYGPITDDGSGVRYLTVRAQPDPGPRYMPESRAERAGRGGGRQLTASTAQPDSTSGATDWLIPRQADGLSAASIRLAPDRAVGAVGLADQDVCLVVLDGSLHGGHDVCTFSSVAWRLAGQESTALVAGDTGATLLVLAFPTDGAKGDRYSARGSAS